MISRSSARLQPSGSRRARLQPSAALLSILALAACHVAPHSAARLPPLQQLRADIDAVLAAPALEHSFWGVLVTAIDSGDTIYSVNARKLLMPASNMKIVTLAVAAVRLGWEYRYETDLFTTTPAVDGVLGDLIVAGSGDPTIGSPLAPHVFDDWAEQLKASGVRRIDGRVVGDDNAFDDEGLGAGWTWDDLGEDYSAATSALQFHENAVRVELIAGRVAGDAAGFGVEPSGGGLSIHVNVRTGAVESPTSLDMRRMAGSPIVTIGGTVALGSDRPAVSVSVDNPTLFFVTVLRNTLIAHGIDVRGPAVDIDDLPEPPARVGGPVLSYRSPPLSTIAERLMKVSQNLYAETLLKTVGAAAGTPTWSAGLAAARTTLESWGVEASGLVMRDGSGLSRYNYVTPQTLVTILTHVARDPAMLSQFEAALPIAGRDGTLSRRMKGTAAEANAHAKTGSLSNVRSLSGFVTTAGGEKLAFSIIANNFETPAAVVDAASDAIVAKLASFRR